MYTAIINMARLVKSKWLLVVMLTVVLGLSACSNDDTRNIWPPAPPFELPLNVEQAGNKVETDFQVIEKRPYAILIIFLYKTNDQIDRARAWKLSGGVRVWKLFDPEKWRHKPGNPEMWKPSEGRWSIRKGEEGVPLSLRVSINQINTKQQALVYQKDINTHEFGLFSSGAFNLDKQIDTVLLDTGRYRVIVEVVYASRELGKTPINLAITYTHGGK